MKTYYFLGIGGIGMSAIARYLKQLGNNIFGYDRTRTPLTEELEKEGMIITYNDDISSLPNNIDMVVFTPAIPKDNLIYNKVINDDVVKRCSTILIYVSFKDEVDTLKLIKFFLRK